MRREEYQDTDQQGIAALLREVEYGMLGCIGTDGWPVVRPVNFVHVDGRIYFHGAHEGEKMDALRADDRVTFVVVKEFSLIPSYLRHPQNACPATQYYHAVMVRGRARIVECLHERAHALQALMEKLQREGGYAPITADDPRYTKQVEATAVTAIEIEQMTAKRKVGQNLGAKARAKVEVGLERRGCPIDHATLAAMRAPEKAKARTP